jgi:DNA-binding IclR family transcriptional regulator
MPDKNSIKSIEKCFQVVGCLYDADRALSLEELVRRTGYKKTSCFRILKTMLSLKILEQNAETKTYQFGTRLVLIGLAALKNMSLHKTSLPILQKLRDETRETVNLSILNGKEILYVERLMSNYIVNLNVNVGDRLPIHCTSMGKAILANLPENIAQKIMAEIRLEPKTKKTIVDPVALKRELSQIKKKGYAENDEELEKGLRAVAAPILNHTGEAVAATNIVWTTARHPSRKAFEIFTPKIVSAAEQISVRLGYVKRWS